ncbi:MAG: hypothetical protein OQL19_05270 [Gammaproteobacteria bacterium]|nr:hypothetical protein [Gammaproteobacteria bacterium]
MFPTMAYASACARRAKSYLKNIGINFSHTASLNLVAAIFGFENQNTMKAMLSVGNRKKKKINRLYVEQQLHDFHAEQMKSFDHLEKCSDQLLSSQRSLDTVQDLAKDSALIFRFLMSLQKYKNDLNKRCAALCLEGFKPYFKVYDYLYEEGDIYNFQPFSLTKRNMFHYEHVLFVVFSDEPFDADMEALLPVLIYEKYELPWMINYRANLIKMGYQQSTPQSDAALYKAEHFLRDTEIFTAQLSPYQDNMDLYDLNNIIEANEGSADPMPGITEYMQLKHPDSGDYPYHKWAEVLRNISKRCLDVELICFIMMRLIADYSPGIKNFEDAFNILFLKNKLNEKDIIELYAMSKGNSLKMGNQLGINQDTYNFTSYEVYFEKAVEMITKRLNDGLEYSNFYKKNPEQWEWDEQWFYKKNQQELKNINIFIERHSKLIRCTD